MIVKDRYKVKITSTHNPYDYFDNLIIRVGRQDTLDAIEDLCLRNMRQEHNKKAILTLVFNDSRDRIEGISISREGDELEYVAFGELEDGTKVLMVPVELLDDGIGYFGVFWKVGLSPGIDLGSLDQWMSESDD